MTLAAVDCHMIGQAAAGDAGNGRYAATLVAAMAATAETGDAVASLVATPEGARALDAFGRTAGVPAADVPRLARAAPRALADLGADAAVFTYVCARVVALPDPAGRPRRHLHDQPGVARGARAERPARAGAALGAQGAGSCWRCRRPPAATSARALRLDPGRVRVVSPYAAPAFTPGEGAAERVRARFGIEGYLLAVGDLGPRKNLAPWGRPSARWAPPHHRSRWWASRGRGGAGIAARGGRALARTRQRRRARRPLPGGGGHLLPVALRGLRPAGARGDGLRLPGGGERPRGDPRGGGRRRDPGGAEPRRDRGGAAGRPSTRRSRRACARPGRRAPRAYTQEGMGRAAWAAVREAGVRIALVGTRGIPAAYSGFETAVERLAERFTARGHEVTVYCRTHMTDGRASHAGARLVHLPTVRSKHLDTLAHTVLSTAHLAARERPDVAIYFIAGNAPAVPLARLAGIPAVLQIDGLDSERAKWSGPARAYLRLAERAAPAAATLAVTDSEAVADAYEARTGRRIPWIPYGAELPDPGDAGWCERLGVEPGPLRPLRGPARAREQRPPAGRGAPPPGPRLAAGGGGRRPVRRGLHRGPPRGRRPGRALPRLRLRRRLRRAGPPLRGDVRAHRGRRHPPGHRGGDGGGRRAAGERPPAQRRGRGRRGGGLPAGRRGRGASPTPSER